MRSVLVPLVAIVLLASAVFPVAAIGTDRVATQEQVTLTVGVVSQAGTPVGGVTIAASWDGGETTATTASNGKVFVDVPRGADVTLSVSAERFVRNFPVTVRDASAREVTVEVTRKGSVTVTATSPSGTVGSASVRLVQDGRTVASGRTNADGTFTSGVVEQGEYRLVTGKPSYYTNRTDLAVDSEGTRTEVAMRTGGVQIEVQVLDDHFDDPQPLDNATVQFGNVGTVRTTGGTAVFVVPVNTEHTIRATRPEYDTARIQYSVEESADSVRLTVQREPKLVVRPANRRVVVGESTTVTVVDAYGDPVPNATVSLDGEAVARTAGDGRARVTIESSGNHTLNASLDGDAIPTRAETIVGVNADGETATPTPTPTATPEPTDTDTDTDTPVPTTTSVTLPGFGLFAAVLGVVLVGFALARRR